MNHQASSLTARPLRAMAVSALQRSTAAGVVLCFASYAWAFQSSPGGAAARVGSSQASGGSAPLTAPEINPALLVGAVVLVVGGLLILSSRRRRAASAPKS
jgi:hypothetical protein